MDRQPNLLLVGCGKMGTSMALAWRDALLPVSITILDPSDSDLPFIKAREATRLSQKSFDIIVLAVKPQTMSEACENLLSAGVSGSLILSIAAGKSLECFEDILGPTQALIRTMPNTPALVGRGFTVAIANSSVSEDQREQTEMLLKPLGAFEWIEDESLMDAVTAVSGSGPAYVFLLIEEMTKAAIAQGLPLSLAETMARETVIGAATLAHQSPELTVETLRRNVTSPGGTTEAALKVLMAEDGLPQLMERAIAAAAKRSRDLS